MQIISTPEYLTKIGSVYKLVIVTARRAVELSEGAPKLVEASLDTRPINVALQEIKEGKVSYAVKKDAK